MGAGKWQHAASKPASHGCTRAHALPGRDGGARRTPITTSSGASRIIFEAWSSSCTLLPLTRAQLAQPTHLHALHLRRLALLPRDQQDAEPRVGVGLDDAHREVGGGGGHPCSARATSRSLGGWCGLVGVGRLGVWGGPRRRGRGVAAPGSATQKKLASEHPRVPTAISFDLEGGQQSPRAAPAARRAGPSPA
eukprot:247171-Prymnesium_polylepis.1